MQLHQSCQQCTTVNEQTRSHTNIGDAVRPHDIRHTVLNQIDKIESKLFLVNLVVLSPIMTMDVLYLHAPFRPR